MNGTTQSGSKSLYVGWALEKTEVETLLREQFEEECTEQKTKAKDLDISEFLKNYVPLGVPTKSDLKMLSDVTRLEKLTRNSRWNIFFPEPTNIRVFRIEFKPYTGYENVTGTWLFTVTLSDRYPFNVPIVTCNSKVVGHRPLSIEEDGTLLLEESVLVEQNRRSAKYVKPEYDEDRKSILVNGAGLQALYPLYVRCRSRRSRGGRERPLRVRGDTYTD